MVLYGYKQKGNMLYKNDSILTTDTLVKLYLYRILGLLWEQEIGSSNLSTPTLENAKYFSTKALLVSGAFTFNDYQSLSFIPINGTMGSTPHKVVKRKSLVY